MPFTRPTLTTLQTQVASDITSELDGADALLRFSNLRATGKAQAGLANLHYGYLDWIAQQAIAFTCTDEFLEGWAALKGVLREPPSSAAGGVTFTGTAGTPIPVGAALVRGDGIGFTTTAAVVVGAGGTVEVTAVADADPGGLTGDFGNTAVGVTLTLAQSIPGVQSNGVVTTVFDGGADIEQDDSLRSRMLDAFQLASLGGTVDDYITWAKQAPGVTRAWCVRNGFGVGTVVIFVMLDKLRAAGGGFPIGTNGVAQLEPRGSVATGDQLTAANSIYAQQAAVGLVYVAAPIAQAFNFTVSGLAASTLQTVKDAISSVLSITGAPGGTVPFGVVWAAIANVSGGNYFTVAPTNDLVCSASHIPVLGTVTYQATA